jgi:hypothetical protein
MLIMLHQQLVLLELSPVNLVKGIKSTSSCSDRGQFPQLDGSGSRHNTYTRGHADQSSLSKRWTPKIRGSDPLRRAATWCITLGRRHPFFLDIGAASVRVRQQVHGMAKSYPHSSSYPLDLTPRYPSFEHWYQEHANIADLSRDSM